MDEVGVGELPAAGEGRAAVLFVEGGPVLGVAVVVGDGPEAVALLDGDAGRLFGLLLAGGCVGVELGGRGRRAGLGGVLLAPVAGARRVGVGGKLDGGADGQVLIACGQLRKAGVEGGDVLPPLAVAEVLLGQVPGQFGGGGDGVLGPPVLVGLGRLRAGGAGGRRGCSAVARGVGGGRGDGGAAGRCGGSGRGEQYDPADQERGQGLQAAQA
uniref:hypothetical protein n=1 Tax=Streptomyces sp. HK1 TaxID=405041 RepID=UPI001F350106|nr:hypothetical protein [Streptomyces sp. HK1]